MRLDRIGPLCAFLVAACSAPVPDCTSLDVQRNLSALLRERVLRAELETLPADDVALRGRVDMATSVIILDARRIAGDAGAGKTLCSATIAIEGMGADQRSIVRSESEVAYWVTNGGRDERFLVGLTYSDLEAVAAAYTTATSAARDRPYPR